MTELLRDIFSDDYEVTAVAGPVSIAGIDELEPDVIVMGAVDPGPVQGLATAEIVFLATRHMRLHRVPIVVLAAHPVPLRQAERLLGATVVGLPFDLETIECVLKAAARHAASATPQGYGDAGRRIA